MTTGQPHPVDPSPALRAYGACVDGLFTYCLSVLCAHDAASAAVLEVRDLARRHGDRIEDPALLRAWLYALARHRCLARLEGGGPDGAPAGGPAGPGAGHERRELASLAWPEAAGTDPEQREALELAVRHRLDGAEVAAVLGLSTGAAAALLDAAGAEVGRTRTALLVLGVGSCPELAQLGGVGAESWRGWVLGPALRRELVAHLVECPTCRGTAERVAGQLGHGLAGLPGLPLLAAPGALRPVSAPTAGGAAFLSGAAAGRRAAQGPAEPRFDQRGFPRHRMPSVPRGAAVRQRVVTTGVLAAVLAAPVVALWSAHRDGGEDHASAVSSVRVDATAGPGHRVPVPEPTAVAAAALPPAVSVGSLELAGAIAETSLPTLQGPAVAVPSAGSAPLSSPALTAAPAPAPSAARLAVAAGEYGNRTVLTLTNTGDAPLSWHAVLDVDWLRLSRDAGTLAPGQRITVTVTVDESRAPQTRWTAHLALPPSTAVVTLEGGTDHRGLPSPGGPSPSAGGSDSPAPPAPSPSGSSSAPGSPSASASAPASPSPSAPPSSPASSASPSAPSSPSSGSPSDPGSGSPAASPSGSPAP